MTPPRVPPSGSGSSASRWFFGWAALAACTVLIGSCGGVRRGVQRVQRLRTPVDLFAGRVGAIGAARGPIVVAAISSAAGRQKAVAADVARGSEGTYAFVAPAGARYLFAFVDESGDHRWQPSEPATVAPAIPIALGKGSADPPVELAIGRGTAPTGISSVDATVQAPGAGQRGVEPRVGLVTDLSAARYEEAAVQAGLWDPGTFYASYGPSLAMLEPYDPARIPVVFVHGAGGGPRNFESLIGRLDRTRYQPWVFHYASAASIQLSAAFLDRALQELQDRHRPARLYLVAHSMGGLVSRRMMLDRTGSGRPLGIDRFVTLATPWLGNAGAAMGVRMSPVVVDMWRDMDPGGDLITHLFDRRLPASVCVGLLFGYAGNNRLMPQTNDGTVTIESVLRPEAQEEARFVRGFNVSHDGIRSDEDAARALWLLLSDDGPCRP